MERKLTSYIDHTLLKPETTKDQIKTLCLEAKQYKFAAVCINPYWVSYCYSLLQDTEVKIATVVGFPLGANTKEVKAFETKQAIENGANEIDMVINIGALKGQEYDIVQEDIKAVVNAAGGKAITKVIIETSLLTDSEKKKACELAKAQGADFVKTSTGFSGGGATVEDVKLMREIVGEKMGVKASGGVRSKEDAEAMIKAGATRIGASSGVQIAKGEQGTSSY